MSAPTTSCPACSGTRTGTRKTSRAEDGVLVRYRFCRCGHQWRTYEVDEATYTRAREQHAEGAASS